MICRRLVAVGDKKVGLTALYFRFIKDEFSDSTMFDRCDADIEVDGKAVELDLLNISGQQDFDAIRLQHRCISHLLCCG